jgi:polysaccharide chain length determinant protein (PEP-CTERM system associated)
VLPGKTFTPEELVRIVYNRKWRIVLPCVVGFALAVGVASRMPVLYRSETLIMVMPQRIPEKYAQPIVTGRIEERLISISDQILSRSRLERIITDFNLYSEQRANGVIMEDLVQRMRNEVKVKLEGKESFRVSYVSRDARVAQKVTERLASLSIEENLKDRRDLTDSTSELLESQLQDAKQRLLDHEKKLEEYRRRYSGQLPTQVTTNLQVIQNAQLQLQALANATNRDRERRLLLERQLADLMNPDPVLAATLAAGATDSPAGIAAPSPTVQLENARTKLAGMLTQYKPEHPDVIAMKKVVKDLEGKVAAEANRPANPDRPVTPAEAVRLGKIKDLRAQIQDIDRQLADHQKEDQRLRSQIAEYQAKIDVVPTRESELVELTRDYDTLQATYATLLTKREESKLAANLERRQFGEQFRVLDPASFPEKPFNRMNRIAVTLGGGVAGLLLGLGMIGFQLYRDSSFKTEGDIERVMNLPVLAIVPALVSDVERRRAKRQAIMANVGALAVIVCSAAFAYVMWRLRS